MGVEELATDEVEAGVCREVQAQVRANGDGVRWREVEADQWTAHYGVHVYELGIAELGHIR